MIEYKGKAPVNTRLNPIGALEGKLSLAYYNSFVWATKVAFGNERVKNRQRLHVFNIHWQGIPESRCSY